MGHANLIAGKIARTDGRFGMLDAMPGRLEGRIVSNLATDAAGVLAVRYEKVNVVPAVLAGAVPPGLHARVVEIRYMGSTVWIDVQVAGNLVIHADLPGSRLTPAVSVEDEVVVSWPRDDAVLLQA